MDKPLPPVGQRAGVVGAHVEKIAHHEIGVARHQLVHRGDARQEAAGKNVALDKIDAFAVVAIALVLNGNGLNRHPSSGAQPRLAGAEKRGQIALPDGFNHLN